MSGPAEITPTEADALRGAATFIDVREPNEFTAGHIDGAVHLPLGSLTDSIGSIDFDAPLVLYCASGTRSAIGSALISALGYSAVSNMAGGFEGWKEENLPWVTPDGLTAEQTRRYNRHIRLPDVGVDGQVRILNSSVVIVGAGGLGSPVALYLAAAGVGRIGIIDDDTVDSSNLQRQILHDVGSVGAAKTGSARERIMALNPDVKVETHQVRLDSSNAIGLLGSYDVIVDATDNFPTRYLINDASLHLRIPVVHASIYRFEGQVSVFDPYLGPCYRCLFELPPPPDLAPSCELGGVLGVLPGVIGSLQATEAVKLILGIGEPLVGRLLIYDALEQDFAELRIRRNPECPACRDESNPPALVDYDDACLPV